MTGSKSTRNREKRMRALGLARYRANQSAAYGLAGPDGNNTTLPTYFGPERALMAEATRRMHTRLLELSANYLEGTPGRHPNALKMIHSIPPEVACVLAAKTIIDCIAQGKYYQPICYAVGEAIKLESELRALRKKDNNVFRNYQKRYLRRDKRRAKAVAKTQLRHKMKQLDIPQWSARDVMQTGAYLVELMLEVGGCIGTTMIANPGKRGKRQVIYALPETVEWLRKAHEGTAAAKPFWLPLNAPPKDWISPKDGGYWTDELPRLDLIKGVDEETLAANTKENCPAVYGAVNHLQRVPYLINRQVYEVARTLWDSDSSLPCLPKRTDEPLPEPTTAEKGTEEYKRWRRMTAQTHERNRDHASNRIAFSRTLLVAAEMGVEPLWFPIQLDFRGRAYAVPAFLNPQGDDLARGLLQFRDPVPVDDKAARWLLRNLANTYGQDKGTWDEREAWARQQEQHILNCAAAPHENTWWTTADKPWQFLAACFDYAGWKKDGAAHRSHLPIHIDGSNNGLQLFSLMLRDESGALATNCAPNQKPQDIYQTVADRVKAGLLASEHPMSKAWLEFFNGNINRSLVKRSVMVLPYGGTKFTSLKYIGEAYAEHCYSRRVAPIATDSYLYLLHLNGFVWQAITDVVTGALSAMGWIHKIADLHTDEGRAVRWTTPTGFFVKHQYFNTKGSIVRTVYGDRYLVFRIVTSAKTLNKKKQRSALSPNFIHSLDASVLVETVNDLANKGVHQIACVHDSFGVPATQVDLLSQSLRAAAVRIFTPDVLGNFAHHVQQTITNSEGIPPPPTMGTFDLNKLYQSEYFFA